MKKLLLLVLVLVLGTVLAACGGDKTEDEKEVDKKVEGSASEQDTKTDESADKGSDGSDNEYFKSVVALLESKGFEITNIRYYDADGDASLFKAKSSIAMVINGEDLLAFEVFDLDPSDENLAKGKETGIANAYFGGMEGELPVVVKDHYFFSMAEGHPDYEEVFKIIEEEL